MRKRRRLKGNVRCVFRKIQYKLVNHEGQFNLEHTEKQTDSIDLFRATHTHTHTHFLDEGRKS